MMVNTNRVMFTQSGRLLLAKNLTKTAKFRSYDLDTNARTSFVAGADWKMVDVDVFDDGKHLVSIGDDHIVRLLKTVG